MLSNIPDDPLEPGVRIGRFVVVRDVEGRAHAVAASAVAAVCAGEDGALLLLPGNRMLQVPQDLGTVLGWLDMR